MEFDHFRMMSAHMQEFTDDEGDAIAAFKAYDREQTGFMSVAELRHLTTKMGQEAVSEEDFAARGEPIPRSRHHCFRSSYV